MLFGEVERRVTLLHQLQREAEISDATYGDEVLREIKEEVTRYFDGIPQLEEDSFFDKHALRLFAQGFDVAEVADFFIAILASGNTDTADAILRQRMEDRADETYCAVASFRGEDIDE